MAEPTVYKVEFEYINPTNVECEVPRDQELREVDETATNENDVTSNEIAAQDSSLDGNDKDDIPKFVYAPVITVTEQEAEYTKGDLKLQKVSVTENISEPGINGAVYYTINSNSNIQSDVIHAHPVRVLDDGRSDDDKPKSRIPMMKFKHAVDKVKANRRASADTTDEIPSSKLPRKTSIPVLQRRASKPDTVIESPPPDEEFDKLYHETISNEPNEIVENIEVKIKDPEKLENKFEEIIQDYDENKVQPINLDKKHTKIPLLKRKSEQEIKISKPVEKGSILAPEKVNKDDTRPEETEPATPTVYEVPAHKTAETNCNIPYTEDNQKTNVKLPAMILEPKIQKQTSLPGGTNEIESKPIFEIATTKFESKIQENDTLTKPKVQRTYSENNPSSADISKVVDVKLKQSLIEPEETATIDPVKVITSTEFERRIADNNHHTVTRPQGVHKIVDINTIQDTEFIQQPSILAQADYGNEAKEKRFVEINKEVQTKDKFDNNPVEIGKHTSNLVTNQKVIITDEANANQVNETELKSEQIITVESTISDDIDEEKEPLENQPAANEKINRTDGIEHSDDTEYTPGKVSRLLQRIRSEEFSAYDVEKDVRKEEIVDIPKKKSVLSKIAMFENHKPLETSKPRVPPKSPTKLLFKDRHLENIDNKPIIVNELLKSTEKHKPNDIKIAAQETEKITIQEPEQSNSDENKPKDYMIEIVDESVKYHEVQFINDLDQSELLIVTNDEENTLNSIAMSHFEPNPIVNEAQIIEPLKTDYLKPPMQNIEEKVPINKLVTESLDYKPIEYEFKDEILDNDAEVFSNEKVQSRIPRRFKSRQKSGTERPKSVAEIDLHNVVKGKVHKIIERINSIEILDVPKRKIDAKERPRKKSVSEMVALFEQKSTATQQSANLRPGTNKKLTIEQPALSEEEYEIRNKELINGRINYGRIENMTYLVLHNGVEMPVLALGTALMDKHLIRNIIGAAIDMGYRAIDTAYIYGNEKEVGEAIRAKIEDGTVRREDLFITSKLWSTYHRPDLVPRACQNSLDAMGLDYFDLYLIHNPMSFKEGNDPIPKIANVIQYSECDYLDAWYGMETLVSKGLAKNIGVSNFNSVQLQRILDRSKVKPVINQVECHPYLSQQRLDDFCTTRDVKLSCFGVLGSIGTPAEMKSSLSPVFDDPLVKVMAAGLNISVAQLLIRYQIDRGHAVVVKASSAARLWEDLQALEISLTLPQLDALSALNKNKRTYMFTGMGDTHRNYPFKIPF